MRVSMHMQEHVHCEGPAHVWERTECVCSAGQGTVQQVPHASGPTDGLAILAWSFGVVRVLHGRVKHSK
jgi:hypothetical protein